jgi:hypothetical protein
MRAVIPHKLQLTLPHLQTVGYGAEETFKAAVVMVNSHHNSGFLSPIKNPLADQYNDIPDYDYSVRNEPYTCLRPHEDERLFHILCTQRQAFFSLQAKQIF